MLVAEDGAQALHIVSANAIDVVVSDVRMPVMDGITLLKKVKASGYKSSVMFVSGFTDVIKPRESYDLGVEAVMSKPVERRHLIAAVTPILAERDELWRFPPSEKAEAVLDAFDSLAAALSQGLLALGRGGLCIHSTLNLTEDPVDLLLDFELEKRRVTGQGIISLDSFLGSGNRSGNNLYRRPQSRLDSQPNRTEYVSFLYSANNRGRHCASLGGWWMKR